jgi:allantoin racemase
MALASLLGNHFSIITIPDGHSGIEDIAKILGVEKNLVSIRTANIPVQDLYKDVEKTKKAFLEEASKALVDDKAEVIIGGCGAFSIWAQDLQKELGVPVIDPGGTAFKIAETLAALNLTQSKITPNQRLQSTDQ